MKKIFAWSILFLFFFAKSKTLHAHKDHKKRTTMPAIGVVQGLIIDSTTTKPIEYASVSLVDLEHNDLITGGLSDKDGRINIEEIHLENMLQLLNSWDIKRKKLDH